MDDGTARRSLYAILVIAFGVVLIGAGCSEENEVHEFGIRSLKTSTASVSEAQYEPAKTAVPFVACYRGESDLFLSTEKSSDVWIEQLREQMNGGWYIDLWCRETDTTGMQKYAIALRKTQGLTVNELSASVSSYQNSGHQEKAPKLEADAQTADWSLIKLGYVSSEKNRANEILLLLSEPVAVKNGGLPVDSISFMREMTDVVTAPRHVVAEMHGGNEQGSFMARIIFNSYTHAMRTDEYCRTYFNSKDGSFSPQDLKTTCESQSKK
jgi:hypothetical protein